MKCICDRSCQVRINGRAVTFKRGEVHEFDECPAHFAQLGRSLKEKVTPEGGVDYDAISREELLEVDGDVEDLKAYCKRLYPDIRFTSGVTFDDLVFRYIEARENREVRIDNTGKIKNTIVEVRAQLDALDQKKELEDGTPDSDVDSLDDLLG